jgi:dipeptidyl aminopeptidase/acylaminoacyl peptidase
MRLVATWLAAFVACPTSFAEEPTTLKTSELAIAFGTAPIMWGMRLSPSGMKLSAIQMHESGVTVARVVDTATGINKAVLSGRKDEFEVSWCDWANEERLLCGLRGLWRGQQGVFFAATRLMAVAADGSETRLLVDRRLDGGFTQFQDRVLDWLPDDPRHVLIQVPISDGSGVSRLDIYSGDLSVVERPKRTTYTWIADGHGLARLYETTTNFTQRWYSRDAVEAPWKLLRESPLSEPGAFAPIGFGENRDELLYFDNHEGRRALFALDLANGRDRKLVYSHEEFDVDTVLSLGKYQRLAAATYVAERTHVQFFDKRVAAIHEAIERTLPGRTVAILDESWDQRFYLVVVGSATDPGTYYRFDSESRTLGRIVDMYPSLAGITLAEVKPIRYEAEDGVEIPGYLTLPPNRGPAAPAVVLPHGGPSARDYWTYDFLAQFLAASGYAVLQSNYRGSDGYGSDWLGEGGFRGWRRALGDIAAGARYLVDEGIANPEHICVVGWSYGGYAALMSAIEHGDMYRCAVSIAGVSDPLTLSAAMRQYVGGLGSRTFIGAGDDVFKAGSPLARVDEVDLPVLLIHPREDANVPFAQTESFAQALRRANKEFEFVEYEQAEHDIAPERYRIDLLARLAEFLDTRLAP